MSTSPILRGSLPRARAQYLSPLLLLLVTACSDQSMRPHPLPDQADLYWSVQLSHHAVALANTAPYDTLQLVATPRNYRDEPLDGMPAPRYTSSDPERVIVTATGMLVAVAATSQPIPVVATLTVHNLTHADTVLVSVVETTIPPVLGSFSIHPIPPDSAKIGSIGQGFGQAYTLPARATTLAGDPIPVYGRDDGGYLPVYIRSLDTAIAKVDGAGVLRGLKAGTVNIYASTNAFGVSKVDTLPFRVGAPVFAYQLIQPISNLGKLENLTPEITIGMGGAVLWWLKSSDTTYTLDVTFDDADLPNVAAAQPVVDHLGISYICFLAPSSCLESGNMLLSLSEQSGGFGLRYFPVPGTYDWRSLRTGVSGRVVVVDER